MKITSFHKSTHNKEAVKMTNIDAINAYKSKIAMNKHLFKNEVLVYKKGRGEVKWVATPETLDIVFGNLKRSIHSRNPMVEIENLFTSIDQNKFATQIKIFTDETLNRFSSIFAAAGHPNAVFEINFENLIALTSSEIKDLTE